MKRPPVPLLLARPLLPETTPSGTAAAISQYPFFARILACHISFFTSCLAQRTESCQSAASGTKQQLWISSKKSVLFKETLEG